ncbi:MAG TPA: YkvA family protein [Candidatus Elarobacter sp.]|nr:YkvA family protein [Candidatus Elarobacter sp.]
MPTTKRTHRPRRAHPDDELADVSTPRARQQKQTVLGAIRDLPNFLRLLYGLMTDPRVAPVDKLLVGGAIVYVIMPIDLIPDFIPIIGEVDDVFVLVLALRRLLRNAGRPVLLDHWMGDPADLRDLNLQRVLAAAAFFLPRRIRRRLRTIGRV